MFACVLGFLLFFYLITETIFSNGIFRRGTIVPHKKYGGNQVKNSKLWKMIISKIDRTIVSRVRTGLARYQLNSMKERDSGGRREERATSTQSEYVRALYALAAAAFRLEPGNEI